MAARARNLNAANGFTVARAALAPVFVWLLLSDALSAAAVVYAVAAVTDSLDGAVARRFAQVTSLGEFLDPTVDKVLVGLALAALAFRGRVPWIVVAVILVREVAVEALRVWLARRSRSLPAAPLGKAKKVSQDFAVLVLTLAPRSSSAGAALVAVALALTLASGAQYFVRAVRGRAGVPWR
jgi:CDP-diacylglycerol--glycerol-3-phosphate 3-phosphatidyltransferase